ncbi:hypothetical protein A6R68_08832, partial [Neotoma lepida]
VESNTMGLFLGAEQVDVEGNEEFPCTCDSGTPTGDKGARAEPLAKSLSTEHTFVHADAPHRDKGTNIQSAHTRVCRKHPVADFEGRVRRAAHQAKSGLAHQAKSGLLSSLESSHKQFSSSRESPRNLGGTMSMTSLRSAAGLLCSGLARKSGRCFRMP